MINYIDTLKKTFKDKVSIIEFEPVKDAVTKITKSVERVVVSDYPCKLSFSTATSASDSDIANVSQSVKLFVDLGITIKEGSKLIVAQENGITTTYKRSGKPLTFMQHQEVSLELFKENGEKA